MWIERFVIVITSLHRDFMPSAWGMFFPTVWDWAILFGSVGLFLTLLFLFVRFFPMISISEIAGVSRGTAERPTPYESRRRSTAWWRSSRPMRSSCRRREQAYKQGLPQDGRVSLPFPSKAWPRRWGKANRIPLLVLCLPESWAAAAPTSCSGLPTSSVIRSTSADALCIAGQPLFRSPSSLRSWAPP